MVALYAVIRALAGAGDQVHGLFLPNKPVVRTEHAEAFPFVYNDPIFAMPAETFWPFATALEREALVRPVRQIRTGGIVNAFAGAFVIVIKPPRTIRHPLDAWVNHAVGGEREFARIVPMHHVGAGELQDVARMVPVLENPRYHREKHLPCAIRRAGQIGGPARHVRAAVTIRQIKLRHADKFPMRATVSRFGNANGRAMDPGDAGKSRHVRAPVGVIHPPFFHERIPDNCRVCCAIVNGVAVQWLCRDQSRRFTSAENERQQGQGQEGGGGFHSPSFTNLPGNNQATDGERLCAEPALITHWHGASGP